MNIPAVFWLVPIASLVALGMAYYFFTMMMKADEGGALTYDTKRKNTSSKMAPPIRAYIVNGSIINLF